MDYQKAFIDLVAYCQREGALSDDSTVYAELANILDIEEEEAESMLDV